MSNHIIWKLILRDARAYKWRIIGMSFLLLSMGMLMIFVNTNLSRMFASGASIIFVTIIFPFITELKNKRVWQHTASLPVTRKEMVTARFIISLAIIGSNVLLWVGAYELLMVLLKADPKYALTTTLVILVSMNLILNLAVFYLIYFRFNFIAAVGIYLILMIVPSFIQLGANFSYGMFIENFNQTQALSIVAVSFLILSFISSIIHFHKKDL